MCTKVSGQEAKKVAMVAVLIKLKAKALLLCEGLTGYVHLSHLLPRLTAAVSSLSVLICDWPAFWRLINLCTPSFDLVSQLGSAVHTGFSRTKSLCSACAWLYNA